MICTRRPALAVAIAAAAASIPSTGGAQLAPPATGGVVALDRLLHGLVEQRRVLLVAAHPDDEDTDVLALLSRGYGAQVAYLSLSRGEGGQNLIGAELGPALGLIRSRELLAAREVDGARQFFARAYDFGYSKSLEETSRHWLPDSILKDVVRVVRAFRPHVIVSIFTGTPRDRHGQHQAAGAAAPRAFEAAGDPGQFPELQTEEGLEPWVPLKLYLSTRFRRAATTLSLETGRLDPLLGRSFHQIAMDSRSRHRSQDMGQLQRIGPASAGLELVADRTRGVAFSDGRPMPLGADGQSPNELNPADADAALGADILGGVPLESPGLAAFSDSLRSVLVPSRLSEAAPSLANALQRFRKDLEEPPGRRAYRGRRDLLEGALTVSAGLVLDAVAADDEFVPGMAREVEVVLYNGGPFAVTVDSIALATPAGWRLEISTRAPATLPPGALGTQRFQVTVPSGARLSQPYFLERPIVGGMYDWGTAPPQGRGQPFDPPTLTATAMVSLLGTSVPMSREVSYRFRDQAFGEVRRPVRVVPRIDVKLEPQRLVWPAEGDTVHTFDVSLTYNGSGELRGEVFLEVRDWPAAADRGRRFIFERSGETRAFELTLVRPSDARQTRTQITAVASTSEGQRFTEGVYTVEYPHIRPTPWVRSATSDVLVAPIRLPAVARVGYVRGASDRVPEALAQIGLPVELLGPDDLARRNLSEFDAIVIGSRAYETDQALARHNDRLLSYVEEGGHLLVQYQQYAFVRGGYAPYPLTIARPHDRVTDETAPVKILDPNNPAFLTPNRIEPADWDGWPQERGLYFAHEWDAQYRVMLESADPGGDPLTGGLLAAQYGSGTYVYTGLSFFRALPAGVPGAFRLFLNLINPAALGGI